MFKFLLIAFCLYLLFSWVIKPLLRILLPSLIKKVVQKQTEKYQTYTKPKPEGTIHVDFVPEEPKASKKPDKGGEYVDYEEVK